MKILLHISTVFCTLVICSNTGNQDQITTDSFDLSKNDIDFLLSMNFHDLTSTPTPSTASSPLEAPKGTFNFSLPFAPLCSDVASPVVPSTPFFKVLPPSIKSSSNSNSIESGPAELQLMTDRRILPTASASPMLARSSAVERRILPSPASLMPEQSSPSPASSIPGQSSVERRILPSPIAPSTPELTFLGASTPSFNLPSPLFPQNIPPSTRPLRSPASSEKRAAPLPTKRQPPTKLVKRNENSTLQQPQDHRFYREFRRPNSSTVYVIHDPPIPEFIQAENEDLIEAQLRYAFELSQLVLDPGFPYLSACDEYYKGVKLELSNVRSSWTRYFYLQYFDLFSSLLYLIDSSIDRSSCESILNSPIAMQTNYRKVYADPLLSFSNAIEGLNGQLKNAYFFADKQFRLSYSFPLPLKFLPLILEGIHILQQMEILQFNHYNEKKNILDFCLEAMKKMKADEAILQDSYLNHVDKFSISSRYADMNAIQKQYSDMNNILQEMSATDAGFKLAIQVLKDEEVSESPLSLLKDTSRKLSSIFDNLARRKQFISSRSDNFVKLAIKRTNTRSEVVYAAEMYFLSKISSRFTSREFNMGKDSIERWKSKIRDFDNDLIARGNR